MRLPAPLNTENTPRGDAGRTRGISIPDRQRIDSDVRAFLREPSTPWIVFDREGRPPSHLAVGELLPVARVSVMSSPQFFPAGAPSATTEPSSLAVAADLSAPADTDVEATPSRTHGLVKAGALAGGLLSVLGAFAFALGASSEVPDAHVASAAMPAEIAPPDLDPKPPPTQATDAPAAPPVALAPAKVDDPKMKFGRLSIAGAASSRDVFLDGKRLLGRGARSFVVLCGAHAVSVGTRAGAQAVDVPCNAELVVAR